MKRRRFSPFFTINIDTQTTTASLANSDGWNDAPKRNRFDPWIVGAMRPGKTSTAAIATIVNHMTGHAHRRSFSASSLAATRNIRIPAASPSTWRMKKNMLEP